MPWFSKGAEFSAAKISNVRSARLKPASTARDAVDYQLELPAQERIDSATAAPETGRWKSYQLLLLARLKEMYREPEVIFWVFVFPILLALGLGIAFRNKPADVSRVAVVAGPEAGAGDGIAAAAVRGGHGACGFAPCRRSVQPVSAGQVRPGGDAAKPAASNISTTRRARKACWPAASPTTPCRRPREKEQRAHHQPRLQRTRRALYRLPDSRACWA